MKQLSLFISMFLFTFLLSSSSSAQSVDEILENYFENIGGKEAWKDLKSMKISGTGNQMGMSFPITRYSKTPNYYKLIVDIQGKEIIEAYDGQVAWYVNPLASVTEPTKQNEEQTKEAAKQVFEDELIDYTDKGHALELMGTEEVDGTETFKIKLIKKNGDEMLYFFDTEIFVPIMVRSYANVGPMKGQAVDTFLSDYQEVEGLMIPYYMEQKVNGQTFLQMTSDTVELNVELNNSIFSFPEGN